MKPACSGYAEVNGIKLYHEIHGEGEPLVLIHAAGDDVPSDRGEDARPLSHCGHGPADELHLDGRRHRVASGPLKIPEASSVGFVRRRQCAAPRSSIRKKCGGW